MPKESATTETAAPPVLPLFISDMLFLGGVLIYIIWTVLYLLPEGKLFDVGLFSICIVITLFGLVGHFHYRNLERAQKGAQ